MFSAIIALGALALVFGLLLGYAAIRFKVDGDPMVEKINAILPQTQCGQCSYPGCRPYATAIAAGEADINRCPPGGEAGVRKLAELLGREPKPLNKAARDCCRARPLRWLKFCEFKQRRQTFGFGPPVCRRYGRAQRILL